MKKYGNEFRVGVIVVCALIGLAFMSLRAGDFSLKRQGYHIFAVFEDIMGLENKAPVRLRGVEVGQVEGIALNYDQAKTEIVLTLWIDSKYKIRGRPAIKIRTLGLMGEKYIQIIDEKEGQQFLKPKTIVLGRTPGDFEEVLESADIVVKNTNDLILELKSLSQNLNHTLEDNEISLDSAIKNLEVTSRNFAEFSEDLKNNPWKLLFRTKEKKSKKTDGK